MGMTECREQTDALLAHALDVQLALLLLALPRLPAKCSISDGKSNEGCKLELGLVPLPRVFLQLKLALLPELLVKQPWLIADHVLRQLS